MLLPHTMLTNSSLVLMEFNISVIKIILSGLKMSDACILVGLSSIIVVKKIAIQFRLMVRNFKLHARTSNQEKKSTPIIFTMTTKDLTLNAYASLQTV